MTITRQYKKILCYKKIEVNYMTIRNYYLYDKKWKLIREQSKGNQIENIR